MVPTVSTIGFIFIDYYFLLIVGVMIAGQPLLRARRSFVCNCWSVSYLLLRERRVEVPKELKKFLEAHDSMARGRARSLAISLRAISFPRVLGEILVFRGMARCIVACKLSLSGE
jgi:hypothetical protein